MSEIVVCPHCKAKNRLRPAEADKRPRCGRCKQDLPWLTIAGEDTFSREIAAPVPVLVDFWASWCGPCRVVAPVLEELALELAGKLKVVKVDVDDNPGMAARFNARSIPMLIIFQNGKHRQTLIGAQPKAALKQALAPFL